LAWQNRQTCRVRYQWNAYQYLSRYWITSWCVLTLMVAILTSTEHIRNFLRSSVWKCIDFPSIYVKFCFIVDNEIYIDNNKHLLRSNTNDCGGRTH
jgi:hypothetical protein